ncbi:hypothetical protein BV898_10545 [Hypsibius exemplaris]|uniref:Uncharacterized protein n=1 Tax=Hypsibius exemplaris TaxID=2072580 RepID=A0A1W0WJG7_HYPEX|nr:hypothetical protein BV898_10545 [Hypsibius exemplaris]
MAATRLTGLRYIKYNIKRAFLEHPEICYTAAMGIFVLPVMIRRAIWEDKHPNSLIKAYKENYTIYRPDDPRSYRIRCSPDLAPDDPHIVVI